MKYAAPALAALFIAAACGLREQSAECKAYVACADVVSSGSARVIDNTYGPTGTCWTTNQGTADACTRVCADQLAMLQVDGGTGVPECAQTF